MKIRIKGNSVRYRLTQSEVKKLCEEKYIEDCTMFSTQSLVYAIQANAAINELSADFIHNKITLHFPEQETKEWYTSNRITYQNNMILADGTILKLLLEKDFVCLDHTDEDQSDNYANPNKTC